MALPLARRFEAIKTQIKQAMEIDTEIAEIPVDLDPHGDGSHLQGWLDAINLFHQKYMKT
jgi:hypothetical protein